MKTQDPWSAQVLQCCSFLRTDNDVHRDGGPNNKKKQKNWSSGVDVILYLGSSSKTVLETLCPQGRYDQDRVQCRTEPCQTYNCLD